jgi:hypothetical protein
MKTVAIAVAALSLIASNASAVSTLTDLELDSVTAGQILGIDCPGCTLASSASMSNNGITTSTSSTTIVPPPAPPPVPGGSGSSGGNGSGNGNGGTTTPPAGNANVPSGPSVVTSIPVPANLAAIIGGVTTSTLNP